MGAVTALLISGLILFMLIWTDTTIRISSKRIYTNSLLLMTSLILLFLVMFRSVRLVLLPVGVLRVPVA